jgi:hypothetical protein
MKEKQPSVAGPAYNSGGSVRGRRTSVLAVNNLRSSNFSFTDSKISTTGAVLLSLRKTAVEMRVQF